MAGPNRLDCKIEFGRNGEARGYFGGRWSHPEDEHTWALSPAASLHIPIHKKFDNLALLLDVEPALSPGRLNRFLKIEFKRRVAFEGLLRKRSVLLLDIGSEAIDSILTLDFTFDDPLEIQSQETRPLAFCFRNVFFIDRAFERVVHQQRQPLFPLDLPVASAKRIAELTVGVPVGNFLTKFESLGHSCDFGIFQRECSAEPLGLLRFGGVSTVDLIYGLLARFEGIGAAKQIQAVVSADWNGEYMVVEQKYGLVFHSFLTSAQAAPEQIIAREARRLPFLARLFLETLDGAEKIFVLRRPDEMFRAEAEAVAAVLRMSSDCRLLWVVQESGEAAGSVDASSSYFVRGHLDVTLSRGSASIQAWLSVCVNMALIALHQKTFSGIPL